MSTEWLQARLGKFFPDGDTAGDLNELTDLLEGGSLTLVKADITNVKVGETNSGTIKFTELETVGRRDVQSGNEWNP